MKLLQQIKRTVYVSSIWCNAHIISPTDKVPQDYGWSIIVGRYEYYWFEGPESPSFQELTAEMQDSQSVTDADQKIQHLTNDRKKRARAPGRYDLGINRAKIIKQNKNKLYKLKIDEGMKLELETRRAAHKRLKQDMRNESERSLGQLEYLSLASNNILKNLSEFCSKLTHGITLLSICRKLETEEEKVAPKLSTNPPLALFKNNQILPLFDDMEQMWAKTMHVSHMNKYMASQLQRLQQENTLLNKKLLSVLNQDRPTFG